MSEKPSEDLTPAPKPIAGPEDARRMLVDLNAFLGHPVFTNLVDLSVLARIAADDTHPVRERRRAGEVLGALRLKALQMRGQFSASREQTLRELGLDSADAPIQRPSFHFNLSAPAVVDMPEAKGPVVDCEVRTRDPEPGDGKLLPGPGCGYHPDPDQDEPEDDDAGSA